jgi:hypothetical protein
MLDEVYFAECYFLEPSEHALAPPPQQRKRVGIF